jgi:pyridoxal phosphate enzyme (YggS family)
MDSPANPSDSLSARLKSVKQRIIAAAERANRPAEAVTLIAISKTHPAPLLKQAIELGVTDLGENRVQEAEGKILEIGRASARWHLVGHLQSNKARRAVQLFDVIHSLDSVDLARRLERMCADEGRAELPVLIQVDLAGESTKSGVPESQLEELANVVTDCERLRLSGLMVLPPFFENAEHVRPFFVKLRELRDKLQGKHHFGERSLHLSMGMTHDFEIAVEEGATMVRVGTAIFGSRPS